MKKILCLFALLALCCSAVAQNEIGYFTGAWYETKVPTTRLKQGGSYDVTLYADGSAGGAIFYDGREVDFFSGTWTIKRGVYYLTLTDGAGWVWKSSLRWSLKAGAHALKGTFRNPFGVVRGSWMGD